MTQYMLSVHHSPDAPPPSPEDMQTAFEQVDAFNAEVMAAGVWVFGGGLQPPEIASVVRTPGGETIITDGPFGETKEHLGGFWIINAPISTRRSRGRPRDRSRAWAPSKSVRSRSD